MMRFWLSLLAFLIVSPAYATEAGWALLREGGQVVLLRHAYAAGGTEPAEVDLDNCRSQRNLNDRGQQQARRIGSLFSARADRTEAVLVSRYCRTIETAEIAFREVELEPFAALDEIADEEARAAADAEIRDRIENYAGSGNLVLVTHDSVIRSLTGSGAREGEAVIVMPGGERLHIAGRVVFN